MLHFLQSLRAVLFVVLFIDLFNVEVLLVILTERKLSELSQVLLLNIVDIEGHLSVLPNFVHILLLIDLMFAHLLLVLVEFVLLSFVGAVHFVYVVKYRFVVVRLHLLDHIELLLHLLRELV